MTRRLASVKQLPGFRIHKKTWVSVEMCGSKRRNGEILLNFKTSRSWFLFKGVLNMCLFNLWNHVLKFASGGANEHHPPNARIPTWNLLNIDDTDMINMKFHRIQCVCVFFSLNDRRGDTWSNVNQNLIWKRIPDVYPNMMKRSYLKTQMFRFLGSSKLSFKYWCCQCLIEGESTVTLASNNCFQTKISKSMKRFPRYEFSSFLVGEWDLFTVLPENISLKKGGWLGDASASHTETSFVHGDVRVFSPPMPRCRK